MTSDNITRDTVAPVTIIGCVLLASVLFMEPTADILGGLPFSVHRQIAADNFVTGCLCLFALYARARAIQWRGNWSSTEALAHHWGEFTLIVGLLLHRPSWFPWRSALEYKNQVFADWWRDELAVITTVGQSLWWVGLIMISYPQLRKWWGDSWSMITTAIVVLFWILGYQLVDAFATMALAR